jgi:hypothetical protein
MNGKLVAAAQHSFDLQNKGLVQNLTARGDTSGLASVQASRDATTAQAQYDEQVQKATAIQQQYAAQVAQVNALHSQGGLTDSQQQAQLNDLQVQEIANLNQVLAVEQSISQANPDLVKLAQQTQAFSTQIVGLTQNTNKLTEQLRGQLESAFADNFSDLITGAKGFKAAFTDMVKSIQKDLANIVSKDLAQSLFGSGGPAGGAAGGLASLFGGGGGSNGFGFLSSLFGGGGGGLTPTFAGGGTTASLVTDSDIGSLGLDGFATGGTLGRGNYGIVGENGPELAYAGSKDMHISPMGGTKGGQSITNNFSVQAPGGTITRQSQTQAAAEMARQASIAARRNG